MKTKQHTVYKDADGKRLPGVTTITGELGWNKHVLVNWANRLGREGIDSTKYVDDKAAIGSLAHDMVMCHVLGTKVDTSDYSENQILQADNCLQSFFEWERGKVIKPILTETMLVSNLYGFGGTPDLYAEVDGKLTLVDYKTGKGIYPEYSVQVGGGYYQLLEEAGHTIDRVIILNIPRAEDESFQVKEIKEIDVCRKIFVHCLNIYKLKKKICS